MKRIILVLFCLLAFPVMASHIVGGEFEIIHLSGNTYRINLILYFDQLNGAPGAKDQNVNAQIFRKSDNASMMVVSFNSFTETPVYYTQPSCSKGEIVTSKLVYTTTVVLPAAQFSDPGGYYISWERCCRNYQITNIYSEVPNTGARYAGQTFYLEFPPVTKNGEPFINSSPRLFPPLNDFACPRRSYYVDFGGTDDDGDSLVYSLVTPLNTKSADALPPPTQPGALQLPRPRPYPLVLFRPGYSSQNFIGGNPDLKISDEGFLTVTPSQQGLFVFAVKCEEFRNGEKIGEVRRDFQMLVVDKCPRAEPPKILGKKLTDSDFTYDNNMSVTFSNSVTDADRAIQVQVSDPDASKEDDNFQEKIKIHAIALNFKKDVSKILPAVTTATLDHGSVKTFTISFDKCPYFEGGPFQVGIVAFDDACSLPLSDTLRITVNIEPPLNRKPYFTTSDISETVKEGDARTYPILAKDDDGDKLLVGILTDGFAFKDFGMDLQQIKLDNGIYQAQLKWDTRCDIINFTRKTSFQIRILVEDMDVCNFPKSDTMMFKLNVKLPGNADPIISTDLSADEVENGAKRKVFEKLEFNVFGNDVIDKDYLVLDVNPQGFKLSDYNITFPQATGNSTVSSHFLWNIGCEKINLKTKDEFVFSFIVVDNANKCRFYKADTLSVRVKLEPPDNEQPLLSVVNTNPEMTFENNDLSILVGQQISLALISNDADRIPQPDLVSIEMLEAKGNREPTGYIFSPTEGRGTAETTFTWNPDCSIFTDNVYENNYTFKFATQDHRCFNPKTDTVEVNVTIKDLDGSDTDFIPPNIITPNGDGCNDFFAMEELEELLSTKCDEVHPVNLPNDNCIGHFTRIYIYNRWGTKVFESEKRNFRWYPVNEAAGVYFYTLKYSHKEYKGTITLMN